MNLTPTLLLSGVHSETTHILSGYSNCVYNVVIYLSEPRAIKREEIALQMTISHHKAIRALHLKNEALSDATIG